MGCKSNLRIFKIKSCIIINPMYGICVIVVNEEYAIIYFYRIANDGIIINLVEIF